MKTRIWTLSSWLRYDVQYSTLQRIAFLTKDSSSVLQKKNCLSIVHWSKDRITSAFQCLQYFPNTLRSPFPWSTLAKHCMTRTTSYRCYQWTWNFIWYRPENGKFPNVFLLTFNERKVSKQHYQWQIQRKCTNFMHLNLVWKNYTPSPNVPHWNELILGPLNLIF